MKTIDKAKIIVSTSNDTKKQSIYDIAINSLHGQPISLHEFEGKKILFVNVASECGFTKQYKDLQALSDQYQNELVVIGSPCN